LKREDLNPNGSFKDRSLAYQISHYKQEGENALVISSSGNAAISAASYAKEAGIDLQVFLSDGISEDKLKRLKLVGKVGDVNKANKLESKVIFHQSSKPKSDAIKFAVENKIPNLRGSVDDTAMIGFKTLGYELAQVTDIYDSLFVPCSSGTSTVGIYEGLMEAKQQNDFKMPKIFIVQTEKIHPIAKEFDKNFHESEKSLADAIVDRVAHRKDQVLSLLEETKGGAFVISDDELSEAKALLEEKKFFISFTSALSVAGIFKAFQKQTDIGSPLAIISGL
jgi:threonine synthase